MRFEPSSDSSSFNFPINEDYMFNPGLQIVLGYLGIGDQESQCCSLKPIHILHPDINRAKFGSRITESLYNGETVVDAV